MELAKTVLHFVLCPRCGKHGHFVTSSPLVVVGSEFYSKAAAFIHLDVILEKKLAREDEVEVMREFVRGLTLPWHFAPEDLVQGELTSPIPDFAEKICKRRFESHELN